MPDTLASRFTAVRERIRQAAIRAGRDPAGVTLLAVSKTHPAAAVIEALVTGQTCFGESRVQEAQPKIEAVGSGPSWHLIGHLQKNKVAKAIACGFDLIHTVDSLALATRLDRIAGEAGVQQAVLVQVNIGNDPQKSGVPPDQADELVQQVAARPHLCVRGLMGMAPAGNAPEDARPCFRALKKRYDEIAAAGHERVIMETLSMGMSGDFEIAVEEGATIVRVGSALFGARMA